jgi:hypothetical protein
VLPRVLTFSAGIAAGAAVVALSWWLVGGGAGSSNSLLQGDPGIAPPEYAYLDNARVLAYLGQIEGGLSGSEKVTEQLNRTRNGGVAASGLQIGASSSQQQFVERVVTPTATARFYRLLDLLRAKGYLETVNYGRGLSLRFLNRVSEGDFVRINGCRMRLPTYAQMDELIRSAHAPLAADEAAYNVVLRSASAEAARAKAEEEAHPGGGFHTFRFATATGKARQRLVRAAARFASALGPNPRIAVSSCTGRRVRRLRGVDLLIPLPLGALNVEPGLLAGHVTVVGKLLHVVRPADESYIDTATLNSLEAPITALERTPQFPRDVDLTGELDSDVTVVEPGAVILPIAIYK